MFYWAWRWDMPPIWRTSSYPKQTKPCFTRLNSCWILPSLTRWSLWHRMQWCCALAKKKNLPNSFKLQVQISIVIAPHSHRVIWLFSYRAKFVTIFHSSKCYVAIVINFLYLISLGNCYISNFDENPSKINYADHSYRIQVNKVSSGQPAAGGLIPVPRGVLSAPEAP